MFAAWVGTVPGARREGDNQPRRLLTPSQPDEGGGAALRTNLSVAALVGVGDGLPRPGPDREGVGMSAVLRAAVGRSGGKTEGKSLKAKETLWVYSILQLWFVWGLFFF